MMIKRSSFLRSMALAFLAQFTKLPEFDDLWEEEGFDDYWIAIDWGFYADFHWEGVFIIGTNHVKEDFYERLL